MIEIPAYELLGVRAQPMTPAMLYDAIENAIQADRQCLIGNHNLHSVYLFHHNAKMRRFYELAHYIFVDGMPLIMAGRLLGMPVRREHRITSIDWLPELLVRAEANGWRILLLGSKPNVAARAAERLRRQYPGLLIEAEHGYFDADPGSAEGAAVLGRVNAYKPHILCVGMGMPRQEHWILDNRAHLGPCVVIALGAFMELLTGDLPVPPRWMGRAGLEWLYRLVANPRRVWRRYLVEPWSVVPYLVRDLAARRSRDAFDS